MHVMHVGFLSSHLTCLFLPTLDQHRSIWESRIILTGDAARAGLRVMPPTGAQFHCHVIDTLLKACQSRCLLSTGFGA